MPELPEVETIARGVDERLRGDRIETDWFSEKPEPFNSPPQLMAKELHGRRIDRVHRVGKHIVFDLADHPASSPGLQWIVHLGMTGRLLVADPATPVPRHPHCIRHRVGSSALSTPGASGAWRSMEFPKKRRSPSASRELDRSPSPFRRTS